MGNSWLVLQNEEKLPKFSPLLLDCGGFRLLELFVLLDFALRLAIFPNPLVGQAEPVVCLAAQRVCRDRLLISGEGFL